MTLDKAKRGQKLIIKSLPDEFVRTQAIKLGIGEGSLVTCREVIPAGPVVLSRLRQEIAISRDLARKIDIEPVTGTGGRFV